MKKHLPNLLTLGNAFCGCVGIIWVETDILLTCTMVFIALIFDFADGMVARLLGITSEVGKQLDSLADAITFGVLPALIARHLIVQNDKLPPQNWLAYVPITIALFSVLRLAKFNVDTRQTDRFIGLPTPANAMLWASLPFILHFQPTWMGIQTKSFFQPSILLTMVIFMSLLLVAELPLISLKFKTLSLKGNEMRFFLIIVSTLLLVFFQFIAIPMIVFVYIATSLLASLLRV